MRGGRTTLLLFYLDCFKFSLRLFKLNYNRNKVVVNNKDIKMGASCSFGTPTAATSAYSSPNRRDPCNHDTTSTTTEAPWRRSATRSDSGCSMDMGGGNIDAIPSVVHPPLNRRSSTQSTSTTSTTSATTTKVWRSILNDDAITGSNNNNDEEEEDAYCPDERVSRGTDHQSCMRVTGSLMPGTPIDEDEFGFSNNNNMVILSPQPKLDFELFLLSGSNGGVDDEEQEYEGKDQPCHLGSEEDMGASLTRSSNTTASDASFSTPCGGSGGSYVLVRALDGRLHRRRHFRWFNTATPTSSYDDGAVVTPLASFKGRLHRSVTFLDAPTDDDATVFDQE